MTEYSREAEALARVLWPDVEIDREVWWGLEFVARAQRAIDAEWVQRDDLIAQGWTPPDPYEDVARELSTLIYPDEEFDPDGEDEFDALLLAVVRRIPDDLARQVAEALRGES